MPTRQYKPTSAGRRCNVGRRLRRASPRTSRSARCSSRASARGGRNALGRMTIRHRGGGHKRRYRVDRLHARQGRRAGTVAAIEYDPNRSARLALLHYADGEKRYILAPVGLRGRRRRSMAGPGADIKPGNAHAAAARSRSAPWCTTSSCGPDAAASSAAAPASAIQLMAKEGSKRAAQAAVRRAALRAGARAAPPIGQVGNVDHANVVDRQGRAHALARAPLAACAAWR